MSQQLVNEQQKNLLKYFEQLDRKVIYQTVPDRYSAQDKNKISLTSYQIQPLILQIDYDDDDKKDEFRYKLGVYKHKSLLVQEVGNLVLDYEKNFKHMLEQKNILINSIEQLNKETSQLIQKQKKYIDLSIAVKESLDYYLYLDKFQFNWVCEPNYRDMFEDQLQPMLSQLTDSINFFTSNTNYTSAKKYLNLSISNKTKVTSFTKSFFIKLLNKQYSYSLKNSKTQIWQHLTTYYPKSKPKFISQFLAIFPQFRKNLRDVTMMVKQGAIQAEINALEIRELQIEQFQLNLSSLSLIGYLQKNIPQIYDEVILKFISFYRYNLHQTLAKNIKIDQSLKFQQAFRECFIQSTYILACEASYLSYCFKPHYQTNKQFTRTTIHKISQLYKHNLSKMAKDPSKNKNPINLCNQLNEILEETQKFLGNYLSGHYETYAFGGVCFSIQQIGVQFVKNLLVSIGKKIQNDLENVCHNFLPKFKFTTQKDKVTENIKQFLQIIPNLKYCPKQSEQYLVGSLDTIIKSIKQCSSKIQSRIECEVWNIQIFAAIEEAIKKQQLHLIKKQMRLEMNQASSMFQRVLNVNRGENFINYATEIFSVLKTGVPTLNQLTLDFNKFITEYHSQLKQKFVKDMVFIHAKNIIEFLQELKQASDKEQQIKKLCQYSKIQKLHNSYLFSMENYVKQSKQIKKTRKKFALYPEGEENLVKLVKEVEEILIDLMSSFYIETSKHKAQTQNFDTIATIRKRLNNVKETNMEQQ